MSAYNNEVYYHIQGYLETWLLATVTQKGASIRLPKMLKSFSSPDLAVNL